MRGGHNRIPSSLKKARGTLRKNRERATGPEIDAATVPPPPRGLSRLQRAIWAELATQVEALGTYAPPFLTAFRLLVEAVAEARDFDPRDPPTARVRARQVASSLLAGFGLVPAARDRVAGRGAADDAKAKAAAFLFGGAPDLKAIPGGKADAEPSSGDN